MRVLNQTPSNLFEAFVGRTTIITGDDLFQSTIEPNGTDFVDIIIDLAALKGEDFLAVNNGTGMCQIGHSKPYHGRIKLRKSR